MSCERHCCGHECDFVFAGVRPAFEHDSWRRGGGGNYSGNRRRNLRGNCEGILSVKSVTLTQSIASIAFCIWRFDKCIEHGTSTAAGNWRSSASGWFQTSGFDNGFTLRNELISHRTISRVVKLTNVRFCKASQFESSTSIQSRKPTALKKAQLLVCFSEAMGGVQHLPRYKSMPCVRRS